ncbi:MAG: hypothetical protein ACKOC4_09410, partial [Planctomycetia bacterium]
MKSSLSRAAAFMLSTVCLAGLAGRVRAEESVPALGRKVFAANKDSLVKVTGVAQIRFSAAARPGLSLPEREDKVRADGTLVDDKG